MHNVIIFPGLGSPGWSMTFLASRLRRQGFCPTIIPYSASRKSLHEVVASVSKRIDATVPTGRLHLVGHSMGGLVARGVARSGLKDRPIGRIVMIGTPLLGSSLAARFAAMPTGLPYGRLWHDLSPQGCSGNGDAIKGVEMAMIAGAVPGGGIFCDGGTDGIVPVSSTRGRRLTDHMTLPVSHALLLVSGQVATAAGSFLETGLLRPR